MEKGNTRKLKATQHQRKTKKNLVSLRSRCIVYILNRKRRVLDHPPMTSSQTTKSVGVVQSLKGKAIGKAILLIGGGSSIGLLTNNRKTRVHC